MREVNFSLPSANKAALSITTQLYDRRALDCTSSLPLINSLNHLAYLTTSSARIRDILTVDGGIERLICILKEGRSQDPMIGWRWNLAFQCVVNVGVRGSESVRRRVVEADMVPVIATILDNYIKIGDRVRSRKDRELAAKERHAQSTARIRENANLTGEAAAAAIQFAPPLQAEQPRVPPTAPRLHSRRPFLAPIDVPPPPPWTVLRGARPTDLIDAIDDQQENRPAPIGIEIMTDLRPSPLVREHPATLTSRVERGLASPPPDLVAPSDGRPLRPVPSLNSERTLSGLTAFPLSNPEQAVSRPESPTTPLPPQELRSISETVFPVGVDDQNHRPMIRPHRFSSGEPDDPAEFPRNILLAGPVGQMPVNLDETVSIRGDDEPDTLEENQPVITLPEEITLGPRGGFHSGPPPVGDTDQMQADPDDLNLIQSAIGQITTPRQPSPGTPARPPNHVNVYRHLQNSRSLEEIITGSPREEDVLMSLQLLAYVSKYCTLRAYFHSSHLVPRLQVNKELYKLTKVPHAQPRPAVHEEEEEEEYLLPNDYNIFPLIEKYTVRHLGADMRYWAGVVMRNLCRKDDTRGGIRQCAYFKCGSWEAYPRQFAKCRRCRRTKYCSKDCQKNAWVYHRHWCVAAAGPEAGA